LPFEGSANSLTAAVISAYGALLVRSGTEMTTIGSNPKILR
jgi:hypothetical protein